MQSRDGRMCYEWNGWLFRAKAGVIEAQPVARPGEWEPLAAAKWPRPIDAELTARLADLLLYRDQDA